MSKEDGHLIYEAGREVLPTQEVMPSGSYKYVRIDNFIVFSKIERGSPNHSEFYQLLDKPFKIEDDDAGIIGIINWATTAEEIDQIIRENSVFYAQYDPEYDAEVYRNRLTNNLSKTKIRMYGGGSTTLGYSPKQKNQEKTENILRELFPGASVLVED